MTTGVKSKNHSPSYPYTESLPTVTKVSHKVDVLAGAGLEVLVVLEVLNESLHIL